MHRLRTFRKAKEEDDSVPPVPTPPSNHKGFKWGKNSTPPPKQQPEVDLQHVLPPTDDFRTSLLMPNLAQRFSILQMEQAAAAAAAAAAAGRKVNGEDFVATGVVEGGDGPAYTVPTPLGDIAETSSIAGSTVGAATQQNRLTTKSEDSSNLEQDGSIMNRSRGGEGNVLFGGRQKVYRVPTGASRVGSSEDLPGRSASPMSGRVVYDHDVTDSAFAKPRKESQDRGASMESSGDYNKNRFTSSSTNSTPTTMTRLSTAATSVASNTNSVSLPTAASVSPLPTVGSGSMASSKPRRPLYEQALDQQLQDHQNSAAGRLERLASIRKLGTTSPPMANHANGSNSQPVQQYTSPTSPTSIRNGNQWPRKRPDSPLSPPEEVAHEKEEKTVELGPRKQGPDPSTPNLGTFNFGLEPVSQTPLSPPVSASAAEFPAHGSFSPGNLAGEQKGRRGPERVVSPPPEEERISLDSQRGQSLSRDEDRAETQTFLSMRSNSSESSYGDESDNDNKGGERNVAPLQLTKQPTVSMGESPQSASPVSPISPASNPGRASDNSVSPNLLPLRNPAISPTSPRFSDINSTADDDSPTLPPAQGLGVLVRQHLRSDSGHSSVYAGSNYNRMSRNSRHGASNGKQASVYGAASKGSSGSGTARPSGASGSSGGNLWEFDDWDGVDYADDENAPPSPLTISDSQGITAPPSIPQKAPGRSPDLRSGGDKREEGDWNKERELATSRAGERERNRFEEEEDEQDKDWEQQLAFRRQIIQQNLRNQEKVNSQHDMPFPPPDLKEGPPRSNGPGFNILKSKSSNGFLAKGDAAKGPRVPGMEPPVNGPPMRPDGRGRMMYDEERMLRDTVRGPHNMPPPHHHHPMYQPPHHLPPHHPRQFQGQQTLATGQPYNRYPPGERSPIGLPHPLHSPMHAPRMRPRPSQEQMNNAQSTPRGVPMGWRDENWGLPRSAPGTQPGTPTTPRDVRMPRKQPSMPGMNGRRDDMRQQPNQGQQFRGREDMRGHDREPRRHPGGPPPHHPPQPRPQYDAPSRPGHESVETSPPPPSHDFRRPRNGSNASPAPTMRQRRGTLDSTPLPPLNTSVATAAALAPPKQSQPSSSATTPYSAVSSERSPAIVQRTPTTAGSSGPPPAVVSSAMTNIQNSNAGFAPAKKRTVDKSQIGEPKLLSATSNIPTRALPPQDPTPPLSDSSRSAKPRGRRMTTTQNIFSGFGKNKSSEEVPAIRLPPSSNHRSDDEIERSSFSDDPPPKKGKGGKLRKSTSDGGALASRSRQQAMTKSPSVPKIQKVMVGMPPQNMDAPEGMI
ncbi:hypothetical protein B9Z19DRAFT_388499 [Tuber borchii]|uniref:Uncharacterized protein n=1 Tax=Tuber borchii TaxID=42251 RepID=A0A2T7A487_TUBBO|nr:hypothetical protein B9Z19DRAFT_388499 [Tuber borchii]